MPDNSTRERGLGRRSAAGGSMSLSFMARHTAPDPDSWQKNATPRIPANRDTPFHSSSSAPLNRPCMHIKQADGAAVYIQMLHVHSGTGIGDALSSLDRYFRANRTLY